MAAGDAGTSKIFPYDYHVKDLKNGLRVVIVPTDYPNIVALQIPVQAGSRNEVEKGMTVFTGTIHVDNLNSYYEIISGQLLNPAWNEEDFTRVKTDLINRIKVDLRDNNEEELGKEALYEMIYKNNPYGHLNLGHIKTI